MPESAPVDPVRQASQAYDELLKLQRDAATLSSVQSLLAWDQETIMPPAGAALRADQLAGMSGVTHRAWTSVRMGELIAACESDGAVKADEGALANVREARREFDRATKLPTDLVEEMARTFSLSMDAWKDARAASDFAAFAPWLEKVVELNRRKAEFYGAPRPTEPGETTGLYDALLDEYEPGMTAWRVERVFKPLRERLTPLIGAIASAKQRPDGAILDTGAPIDAQIAFNRFIAEAVGFDFTGGRLDVSTHPFSETVGPGDIRMTTRYSEARALDSVFTTLHESGHSLYEQGLPKAARFGQPLATYISLGIHESQSRMWENFVGRSPSFWKWALPHATRIMGPAFARFTP
ncbi:MAG: carboxypeptidase M32, partial [Phycisphaerales bacterium]|nr:carboxypeptidase M32 [Phycisphaerales bacterium]